jgi:hypothetical protein
MEFIDLSCDRNSISAFASVVTGSWEFYLYYDIWVVPRLPTGSPARDELGLPRY